MIVVVCSQNNQLCQIIFGASIKLVYVLLIINTFCLIRLGYVSIERVYGSREHELSAPYREIL